MGGSLLIARRRGHPKGEPSVPKSKTNWKMFQIQKHDPYFLIGAFKGTATSFKELVRMTTDCAAERRLGGLSTIKVSAISAQPN